MTYAPDDLKAVQRYCHDKTGQDWAALGIVGDTSHNSSGGYHVGHDVLHNLGTAPEQPGSDYSYTESKRDRAGLTDAASAFDLGGGFARFRDITLSLVMACRLNDPRCRDIREVIYTPDGHTVKRWDALGKRSGGDDSHLSHTHISFFRDSEGHRANDDNFLGLLRELFENSPHTTAVSTPAPAAAAGGNQPGSRQLYLKDPHFQGPDVKFVQAFIGARCGAADGDFGAQTKSGVVWYQNMRGLVADGIVGPASWRAMGKG